MKHACIVIKNETTLNHDGAEAVLETFRFSGYTVDELRIFPKSSVAAWQKGISALTEENIETLWIIAERETLPLVKGYLEQRFGSEAKRSGFGDAGIYEKKCAVFLISADNSDMGTGFVQNACIPYLQNKYGVRFEKVVIRTVGANASRVRALLAEAERISTESIRVFHTGKYDEDSIAIVYDGKAPKMLVDEIVRLFADGLGDTVYALSDISLEQQLVTLLKLRGKKISVAESFTGGGIAKRLTSVSGASEVYFEGINAYDERAKEKRLGVLEYTLKTNGAVSDQTAYEMAVGLLKTGDCDVAIATTGLAGPKSDRSMLPVGLCYIAIGVKERIFVYRYKFDGDRREITEKAINYALFLAYKQLKDI